MGSFIFKCVLVDGGGGVVVIFVLSHEYIQADTMTWLNDMERPLYVNKRKLILKQLLTGENEHYLGVTQGYY